MKKHVIAIVTGPSAVGKTTIAKEVLRQLPNFKSTVTYTTRDKRDWAAEDKVINYVSKTKFQELIQKGQLIEWAEVYGNFYGTGKIELLETLEEFNTLLNIDVQGALNIKKNFPNCVTLFIKPDNMDDLKKRIDTRPLPKAIKAKRWVAAKWEVEQADKFDHQIINYNNQIEKTVAEILKILTKY
jgi:guanylate kinase